MGKLNLCFALFDRWLQSPGPDVLGLQQLACVDFWRCEAVDAGPD
jgi:hypothetical protein